MGTSRDLPKNKEIPRIHGTDLPVLVLSQVPSTPSGKCVIYVNNDVYSGLNYEVDAGISLRSMDDAKSNVILPLYRVVPTDNLEFPCAFLDGCGYQYGVLCREGTYSHARSVILKANKRLPKHIDSFIATRLSGVILRQSCVFSIPYRGKSIDFEVVSITPRVGGEITRDTVISLQDHHSTGSQLPPFSVVRSRLATEYSNCQEGVMKLAEAVHQRLTQGKGMGSALLLGPPGTGKTYLVSVLSDLLDIRLFTLSPATGSALGEDETRVQALFREAGNGPALVFIDEIDALFSSSQRGQRVAGCFCDILDTLSPYVFVLGATNRPEALAQSLRRYGRFSLELRFSPPDMKGRSEMLSSLIGDGVSTDQLDSVTEQMSGYTQADIAAVARRAVLAASERGGTVNVSDLRLALSAIPPSALRSSRQGLIERPRLTWDDIGGLESVKAELRDSTSPEWRASLIARGLKPPAGVLLYGPPGCAKTLMARAVAATSSIPFIQIAGAELVTCWVGESEAALRRVCQQARSLAPSCLFIDEIDALAPRRDASATSAGRVVSTLLEELDQCAQTGVLVIAATNRPDQLDPSLLRAGRLDRRIFIPLPDEAARLQIFRISTRKALLSDVDIENYAKVTDGYSGAEITALCKAACSACLRRNGLALNTGDFAEAALRIRPRITPESLNEYYAFAMEART